MSMRIGIGAASVAAGRRFTDIAGELADYEKAGVEVEDPGSLSGRQEKGG